MGFIKNAGKDPKNRAIVVIPKAKQSCLGNLEAKIEIVIGMVILNSPTPTSDNIIFEFPKRRNGNAKELIKETTKLAFRYRTKNLVIYMIMALARCIELKHIYAVSNEGYYANNHVRIDRKLKTDFGAFWEELGGHVMDDRRFYEIPLNETRKTMEEIPARKRAIYRKRFAFQDDVEEQIFSCINHVKRK